jgi:hypothetical protein
LTAGLRSSNLVLLEVLQVFGIEAQISTDGVGAVAHSEATLASSIHGAAVDLKKSKFRE